jgi:putative acetyltransferase
VADGLPTLADKGYTGAGCCAVQPVRDGGREDLWELNRVYVSPAGRGARIATGLLERAEDLVRSLGGTSLRLETGVRQTAAIRMYERAGYRPIPIYPPHDQDQYALCYEKALTGASS